MKNMPYWVHSEVEYCFGRDVALTWGGGERGRYLDLGTHTERDHKSNSIENGVIMLHCLTYFLLPALSLTKPQMIHGQEVGLWSECGLTLSNQSIECEL